MSIVENPISRDDVIIDPRSSTERMWEKYTEYPYPPVLALLCVLVLILIPEWFPIVIVALLLIASKYRSRPDVLPLHLPSSAKNKVDLNDPQIGGGGGFNKPQGVFFMGYLIKTWEHIYVKFEAVLRHLIILGTTGAGKTETLISVFANFLAFGSGGGYTDAKGTSKFWVQFVTVARAFGRDDDCKLINFSKGEQTGTPDPAERSSNTTAPYSFGTADQGIQLTNSLMPEDAGSSNKVFQDSAVALISAVFPSLIDLRDLGLLTLDPKTIRKYTNYKEYCSLMKHPLISASSREAMVGFIKTRSGFTETKGLDKQPEEVTKQFGFAQAYFARCLQMLADTYGNIYMYGSGEVDFRDAILNDRLVCTILPSMTKSISELGSLGKLILSAKKASFAIGLGSDVEGTTEDLIDSGAMASNRPIIDINDEYSFMAVKGYAIAAAQCRGIKVVVAICNQDWAGIKRAEPDEAEQFWANSRLKYFMAMEGDSETWPRIRDLAAKTYAYVRKGMTISSGGLFGSSYENEKTISLEKIDAIELSDFRKLNEGEGVLFYMDKMLFIRNFWYGITRDEYIDTNRIHRSIRPIYEPARGKWASLFDNGNIALLDTTSTWLRNLETGDLDITKMAVTPRLKTMFEVLQGDLVANLSCAGKGLAAIHAYHESEAIKTAEANKQLLGPSMNVLQNQSGTFGASTTTDPTPTVSNKISGGLFSDEKSPSQLTMTPEQQASNLIQDLFASARAATSLSPEQLYKELKGAEPQTQLSETPQAAPSIPAVPKARMGLANVSLDKPKVIDEVEVRENAGETAESANLFDDDGDIDSFIQPPTISNILPQEFVQQVHIGTSTIEQSLGRSSVEADKIGHEVASGVLKSTQYPQNSLDKGASNREEFRAALDNFILLNKPTKN